MTKAGKIHGMLAEFHKFAATEHSRTADEMSKDAPGQMFHKNMAEHHSAMADAHATECEEANKVAVGEVAKVSAVAPTVPSNIRAVPRYGQRIEKADVPVEFAKLVTRTFDEE